MGEIAAQNVQDGLVAPGGDEVSLDQFIPVGDVVLNGEQHAGVDGVLVEEFVDAVGVVLDDDAHRAAQVNRLHLLQREGNASRGVFVLLVGHKVVEAAIAAQVIADEVGVGRVGSLS